MKAIIKKARLFIKDENTIFVDRPIFYLKDKNPEEITDEEYTLHAQNCKLPNQAWEKYKIKIINIEELPAFNSSAQLYLKDSSLKMDLNWERQPMSFGLIKKKQIEYLQQVLKKESEGENPDLKKILKIQIQIEELKALVLSTNKGKIEILELAKKNIDERSEKTEKQKNILKEKLDSLISKILASTV